MEEMKCIRCGKADRMARMLVCGHCGSFFCADCASVLGDSCPQCLSVLSRLS